MKYYNIRRLISDYPDSYYYMVIGERSNGKTYSAMSYALERYIKYGEQFAYVRRWGEDIRKNQLTQLFAAHVESGELEKVTNSEFNLVDYTARKFCLGRVDDEGKKTILDEPMGFAFDLNSMEHYKSISYPKVTTIIFDEFLSRNGYLPNEFILFTNVLSTLIRQRNNVKIFMLGNTVNKYCPYFTEMGLTHIKEQKQGTVDVYYYATSGLKVVVEYCESTKKRGGKKSDVYFAFDNPELQMITAGSWEISIYPHLPVKYRPKDVAFQFFIDFDSDLIHAEFIVIDTGPFIFFHRKTTPIKNEDMDVVYSTKPSERWNYRMGLTRQTDKLSRTILQMIREHRCFYSDNEVGEIVRNYMIWSESHEIIG